MSRHVKVEQRRLNAQWLAQKELEIANRPAAPVLREMEYEKFKAAWEALQVQAIIEKGLDK